MKKNSVNFGYGNNNDFLVETVTITSKSLNKDTVCKNCCFYSGLSCHGHGYYWGTCSVYNDINPDSNSFDNVVSDNTKCKVFKYAMSLNKGEQNE